MVKDKDDPLDGWTDLGMAELIQKSKEAPLEVMWFNAPNTELLGLCDILDIRARLLHINTIDKWKKLADTCLTVRYHDQKDNGINWFEPGAMSYTIQQWSVRNPVKRRGEFNKNIIISVRDTVKKKRILVDGNDRATILTSEVNSQVQPNIDVFLYEWCGEHVNMIFPCEFCQFYNTSI